MLKVSGSDCLDFVVDEGVQIHGGMGYSAETLVERAYRDARINKIFEGTNEINRLLLVNMILKKGMKGQLDLMGPAMKVADELMSVPSFEEGEEGLFAEQKKSLQGFKKAVLMVAGSAVQKLMATLAKEQEVLMGNANMIIDTYLAESMMLRVEKLVSMKGEEACAEQIEMVKIFFYEASYRINKSATDALNSFAEGDELKMMLLGLKRFTKHAPFNIKAAYQKVALKVIEKNEYCF